MKFLPPHISILALLSLCVVSQAVPFVPGGGKKAEPITVIPMGDPLPVAADTKPAPGNTKTALVVADVPRNAAPRPVTINSTTRNETPALNGCVLAENGVAQAKIVISDGAGPRVKFAADDLKRILGKMTGAEFEVQTGGDGKSGLVIGTQIQFSHPELKGALQNYSGSAEDVEAFAIRTTTSRVLMLGNTDMGATDAVYRFLDELGYRQLMPGTNWEVIPGFYEAPNPDYNLPNGKNTVRNAIPARLVWQKDITDRPEVISRHIWAASEPYIGQTHYDIRNLHNSGVAINAGHNYYIAGWNPTRWKNEWWSLIGAERKPGTQIDYGNKEARQYVVDYALDYFRKNPNAQMVSLGPGDNGSWSQSPEFAALGTVSDAVFGMVNEAARAVAKEFPGKLVGVYAYREYGNPPSFNLESNVYVQITPALFNAVPNAIELWQQKCSNLGRYDYYSVYQWGMDNLPGNNVSYKSYLVPRIANYIASNATSIDGESTGGWFLHGHGYWIACKLMWNSSLDYDELKTDFLKSAFGPALEPMRDFYELRNGENHYIISRNLISDMRRDLDKAVDLAKGRPDVLARLDDFKLYLRFCELGAKTGTAKDPDARAEALGNYYRHIMRSANSAMMESYLAKQMLYRATISGVDLTKHPELQPGGPNTVWSGELYTKAEIDDFWKETSAFYNAPTVELKNFDTTDLVPVVWKGEPQPGLPDDKAVYTYIQDGSIGYGLYSLKGEPLKVQVKWNYYAPQKWTLKDKTGAVVAEGTAFETKEINNQVLEMPVPGPGYYFFEMGSQGGWLTVTVLGNQIVSNDMMRNGWPRNYGMTVPTFFYVPKGTKVVSIMPAGVLKLLGPDGKLIFEKPDSGGEWAAVPVPPGLDGTVWQFASGLAGAGSLGNVPKIMAVSPSRLMVPRDIALKDGLQIRQ